MKHPARKMTGASCAERGKREQQRMDASEELHGKGERGKDLRKRSSEQERQGQGKGGRKGLSLIQIQED